MSPFFSATLLTIGAVLLWRSGWATRRHARKQSKPQKQYVDFWTNWNAPQTGTPSKAARTMDDDDIRDLGTEFCDMCIQRATYIAFRDDLSMTLCDHHTHEWVDPLVAEGFLLHLLPGARAASVG